MPDWVIRRVTGEDLLHTCIPLTTYAFRATPTTADSAEEQAAYLDFLSRQTVLVGFAAATPAATATSYPMQQSVRGRRYPMSGVSAVATDPQQRRRGYGRAVVVDLLRMVHEDEGLVFAGLYPFRESFYQRLGFVTFPQAQVVQMHPLSLTPLLKADLPGEVTRHLHSDALNAYDAFLNAYQVMHHGMARPSLKNLRFRLDREPQWIALARSEGIVVGAMLYTHSGFEGTLEVEAFHYSTPLGRALLLQWLAHHADHASVAQLTLGPAQRPETWLEDLAITRSSPKRKTPMGRVLDISRIGGMQVGPLPDSLLIQVDDLHCPWNSGTWRFNSNAGQLSVQRADTPHIDVRLSIHGLTALVYGTHDPADFALRGWGDPTPTVQALMRLLFPPALPDIYARF